LQVGHPKWVVATSDCWQSKVSCRPPLVHVDLRSVTFVDTAGKKLLTDMYRKGVKLLASDCQMTAVVAEIEAAVSENG
jgi:anti-anti-sigma regulatory factor